MKKHNLKKSIIRILACALTNVSYGNTYPIPRNDANFTKWSGINHDVIRGIKIDDLQDIGKKSIKRRHHYYIRKFLK